MEYQWIYIILQFTVPVFFCKVDPAFHSELVGSDVTLLCISSKLPKLLDWNTLTVEWNKMDRHLHKQIIYTFEDGRAHVTREGAVVDRMNLLQSNASLKLHNISVGDEGQYTCRIITPVVDTVTATLEVLAQPSVWLPDKAVLDGEEKMIQCDIRRYYPRKLTVSWVLQNASHTLHTTSPHYRVCTQMATNNVDGTYSIRSAIIMHASELKDGDIILICQVEHQTYDGPFNTSVTITLQAQPHSALSLMAITAVGSFLLVLAVVGAVLLLLRWSRRKAEFTPNISEINQPSVIYADVGNVLKCVISGVCQEELQVQWLKLGGGSGDSEVSLLNWEDVSTQASLESHGDHYTSVLSICLSTTMDKSRYSCLVHWRGQKITRYTTVHVKADNHHTPTTSSLNPCLSACCHCVPGQDT